MHDATELSLHRRGRTRGCHQDRWHVSSTALVNHPVLPIHSDLQISNHNQQPTTNTDCNGVPTSNPSPARLRSPRTSCRSAISFTTCKDLAPKLTPVGGLAAAFQAAFGAPPVFGVLQGAAMGGAAGLAWLNAAQNMIGLGVAIPVIARWFAAG